MWMSTTIFYLENISKVHLLTVAKQINTSPTED